MQHTNLDDEIYHDNKQSLVTTIFFYIFMFFIAVVLSTIVFGLIIGVEEMVEMIGEWIYELKFDYAAKI